MISDAPDLDQSLWVVLKGVAGRCYMLGNCHTSKGRIRAWSEQLDRSLCVSRGEVAEASRESAYWIAGFLAGNEPAPSEMFGAGMHEAPDDDPRWERWRLACDEFRGTGEWPHAPWGHLVPFPPGARFPVTPWALRGDEVWIWNGEGWAVADPQPQRQSDALEATVCLLRGDHEVEQVTSVHTLCIDCGLTSEWIPEEFDFEDWESEQYRYVPRVL